jgi:hypothetical protein
LGGQRKGLQKVEEHEVSNCTMAIGASHLRSCRDQPRYGEARPLMQVSPVKPPRSTTADEVPLELK